MVAKSDRDYVVNHLEIAQDALNKAASRLNRIGARELRDEVQMLLGEAIGERQRYGDGLTLILQDAREME